MCYSVCAVIVENQFDARKNMIKDSTVEDIMVAKNSSNLFHADASIKEAIISTSQGKLFY